jgi:RNA polymerase subunit RPABC4/transcription elongation factor Spt4
MNDPMGALGGAMGAFFANAIVQGILYAWFGYMILLWIVAAYWAFRDMRDRTENPLLPFLATGLIIMFLPFFFPLGVVVYRVVRPPERLGDVYERNLAEEALLAEVEAVKTCRNCDRRVDPEWILCPWCRQRLNRVCPNCERLVGLDWSLCAWCGKDFERAAIVPAIQSVPAVSTTPVSVPKPAVAAAAAVAQTAPPVGPTASGVAASSPLPRSLRGGIAKVGAAIIPDKQAAGR